MPYNQSIFLPLSDSLMALHELAFYVELLDLGGVSNVSDNSLNTVGTTN